MTRTEFEWNKVKYSVEHKAGECPPLDIRLPHGTLLQIAWFGQDKGGPHMVYSASEVKERTFAVATAA